MYLPDRSSPREDSSSSPITSRISNVGDETAQLLSRHWIITDAEGEVQEVRGPGVVGEQPVLEPGMSFEYTSYCPLTTNVGTMHGSYTMVRPDGETFDARDRAVHARGAERAELDATARCSVGRLPAGTDRRT